MTTPFIRGQELGEDSAMYQYGLPHWLVVCVAVYAMTLIAVGGLLMAVGPRWGSQRCWALGVGGVSVGVATAVGTGVGVGLVAANHAMLGR